MTKRENTFKKHLIKIMGNRWHVQSHEDKHVSGIPDLSYGLGGINGWIELKQIPAWNADKPVRPEKFTPLQINWLKNRNCHGGNCYIMVKIGRDYFLMDGNKEKAKAIRDGLNMKGYIENCVYGWIGVPIDPDQLAELLTGVSC